MEKSFIPIMKLLIVLVALFIIPLLFSCEDSDEDIITYYDTYIDGYITDYHTGQPVAGVEFNADYFDESNGGLFGSSPYRETNIAVSNSEGYYRIKIPKHGELGSIRSSVDFIAIRIFPKATEDYNFEFGTFDYSKDSINIRSKRVDIRPITYGYLKVIMPNDYNENWTINPWEASTYEKPFYKGKFVEKQLLNTNYKLLLFEVPLGKTRFSYGINYIHDFDFTINNPKDTLTLNIENK